MHPLDAERRAYVAVTADPAERRNIDPARAATVWRPDPAAARAAAFVSAAAAANVTAWMLDARNTELGAALARAGGRSELLRKGAPFPTCSQWTASLGNPSYGAARYVVGAPGMTRTLVLATSTDPLLDTGGYLHAFDAATGVEVWQYSTTDSGGTSYGLKGMLPAVDLSTQNNGTYNGTIFIAYGTVLAALRPNDGAKLAVRGWGTGAGRGNRATTIHASAGTTTRTLKH